MKDLDWLFDDSDYNLITNNNEYDWVFMKLRDNGITSPSDSLDTFKYIRFEYSYEDCPKCGLVDKHYKLSFDCWKCKGCENKFTITSCTYLNNTKLEYYQWFRFCYLLGNLKITNSCNIAQDIKVTQKTAWWMLDTVRTARKENTEQKFKNGAEVLTFNHFYDIVELLLKRKEQPEIHFNEQLFKPKAESA